VRAAFFESAGTMRVRVVDPPRLEPGDALVRVRYCGICGSDVSLYKSGIMSGPDSVIGHEVAGVVEEDSTNRFGAGDRVAMWPARGCGECVWCKEGRPRYCLNPPPWWGGLAEFVVARSDYLIPLPSAVDDRAAALAEPLGVAMRGVLEAGVRDGDLAYVSGLGSIGLLVVAALLDAGARVIGADVREDRRELALASGCELVFDPLAEDPWWKTLGVDPHGPRFAFECSGAAAAVQSAFNVCGHRGTVVLLGMPFEPAMFIPPVMAVKDQRALSFAGPTIDSMRAALSLLERRPDIARVVTRVVPLEQTGEALEDLARGTGDVKILVDPAL
jgi:threonine dehydrogenase-like Zn-dependent dehydrogenase